jgi:hypothetical protein
VPDDEPVQRTVRELLPEEEVVGSDDPEAQAEAIIAESEERQGDRNAAPSTVLEHRTSDETVSPTS